jgi:hypothetical protein
MNSFQHSGDTAGDTKPGVSGIEAMSVLVVWEGAALHPTIRYVSPAQPNREAGASRNGFEPCARG